jgi:hypothetical protein
MLTGFRRGGKPASGRARKASPPGRSPKGQRDGASRHLPGFQGRTGSTGSWWGRPRARRGIGRGRPGRGAARCRNAARQQRRHAWLVPRQARVEVRARCRSGVKQVGIRQHRARFATRLLRSAVQPPLPSHGRADRSRRRGNRHLGDQRGQVQVNHSGPAEKRLGGEEQQPAG